MSRYTGEPRFQFATGDPPAARRAWRRRPWAIALILTLVVAGAGGYLYRHPGRAPGWLRASGLLPPPPPTVVYRWRDARGEWHITDQPPAQGLPDERLEYRPDTNVLPVHPGAAGSR